MLEPGVLWTWNKNAKESAIFEDAEKLRPCHIAQSGHSHWFLNTEIWVTSCESHGGHSSTGASFSDFLQHLPPNHCSILFILRCVVILWQSTLTQSESVSLRCHLWCRISEEVSSVMGRCCGWFRTDVDVSFVSEWWWMHGASYIERWRS